MIPAIALPSWMKAAARCGFNVEPILADEGIELDLIRIDEARVPLAALDRALERCIAAAGDSHFPFVVGEAFAFEYLPEVETFLTTSSSLRDAARVLEWIPALVNPLIQTRITESAGRASVALYLSPDGPPRAKPYHAEMFFATILKFARTLSGAQPGFTALHFRHPAPSYADKYEPFFGLPVTFDAPRDELLGTPDVLDRPLDCDFPALHRQAEALVAERVAQHQPGNIVQRVEQLLVRRPTLLAGGLDAVARQLALGPRTLQRRLQAQGAGFSALQDAARRQLAQRWLADGMRLEHIAERLGYADRRSLSRACKRWWGETPSAHRKRVFDAEG